MSFNLDLLWKRSVTLACFLLCLLAGLARAQAAGGNPVKLAIETPRATVAAGDRVDITVALQNTDNNRVNATKNFQIELEILQPNGKLETMYRTIENGKSATTFQPRLNVPGLVKIRAKNPELLEGSMLINVKSSAAFKVKPGSKLTSTLKPGAFSATPLPVAPGPSFEFDQDAPLLLLASLSPTQAPLPLPASSVISTKPLLSLCASKNSAIADGKDQATIQLFLKQAIKDDLKVSLMSFGGRLNPPDVVIPRGKRDGIAHLTSDRPGEVTVMMKYTTPPDAEVKQQANCNELKFSFEPPITQLVLKASPRKIYLHDRSKIIVELKDENGKTWDTKKARKISLSFEEGNGNLEPSDISIQPEDATENAMFTPLESGTVRISAVSPNLKAVDAEIVVDRPWKLIILSFVGGFPGALFALWRQDRKGWQMQKGAIIMLVISGMFIGSVLYWAIVLGALPQLPFRVPVVSGLSAFFIPALVGWLVGSFGPEAVSRVIMQGHGYPSTPIKS